MKKFLKLFTGVLTLSVGCGMAVANPAINMVEAIEAITPTSVANAKGSFEFKAKNMPTSVDADKDTDKKGFFIPTPAVSNTSAKITINVRDSRNTFTYTIGASENKYAAYFVAGSKNGVEGYYFKYNASTDYNVYFTAEVEENGATSVYSSSYYLVKVSNVSYSFDKTNADKIPNIIGVGDKILIPSIKVVNSSSEDVDTTITTKVIKNGNELSVSASGELTQADGKLYLTPSEAATYVIRYTNVAYNLSVDYDINASETFKASNVVLEAATLTMDSVELGKEITFPMPKVTDTYHNLDNVKFSSVITIVYKDGEEDDDNNEDGQEVKLDADEFKYTFTKAGSYTIKYAISNYYLNDTKTLDIQIAEDVQVNDTIAPEVSFVADYDTTATDWEKNIKILGNYALPTKVGYDGLTVPAIYAKDLGTSYNDLKAEFKRILVSVGGAEYDIDDVEDNAALPEGYVADYTKAVKFSFKKKENESDEDFIKRVKGTYTLEYRATEIVGVNETRRTGTKSVSIQILGQDAASYTDDTKLAISLPTISSSMKSSDTKVITVNKPTDDGSDEAIETHYYYYYGEKSVFGDLFGTEKVTDKDYSYNFSGTNGFKSKFEAIKIDPNNPDSETYKLQELEVENNKLTIELADYVDATEFTLVAVAINDQGQFVCDTQEISIKNSTTDLEAASVTAINGGFVDANVDGAMPTDKFILGETSSVSLPEITFNDLIDTHMNASVHYYINTPENGLKSINGGQFVYDEVNKTVTIQNGLINLTQQGVYYVVYTVKDDANNVYDYTTSFTVEKKHVYSVKVEYDNAIDINDTIEINAFVVDEEGKKVEDAKVDINFTGLMPEIEETEYTFNYAGDYSFIASATVGGQKIETGKMTIKVSEVKFKWNDESKISVPKTSELSPATEYSLLTSQPSDWTTNYNDYYTKNNDEYTKLNEATAPTYEANKYYNKNDLVYVELTLSEANQNGKNYTASIKVTNPSGDAVEVLDIEDADGLKTGRVKFLAEKEGKYTIVLSAGDGDNKISKTFYCQVGDNNKPVVSIANKTQLQKDVIYNDNAITYKLTYSLLSEKSNSNINVYKVTVKGTANSETVFSYDVELSLYDIDRVGNKKALTWADAIKNSSIKLNNKSSESSSEYVWTISSIDDYELKITATDTFGNESVAETVKFKVVDKSSIKEKEDNKVGIILIIISIIILAGIICFFAFSGKSGSSKSKKKIEKPVVKSEEDENKAE